MLLPAERLHSLQPSALLLLIALPLILICQATPVYPADPFVTRFVQAQRGPVVPA